MRHWFRTQSHACRHPDGKSGLLQIYKFSDKAKNRPSICEAVYWSAT
jgi:hypothetical protein